MMSTLMRPKELVADSFWLTCFMSSCGKCIRDELSCGDTHKFYGRFSPSQLILRPLISLLTHGP